MKTPPSVGPTVGPSGADGPPGGDAEPPKEKLAIALHRIVSSGEPIDSEANRRLIAALIAEFGHSTFESQEWKPYADGDSNILVGATGSKRVKLDDLLAPALIEIGYERVAKLIYRARWSTPDVEHMLRFDTYGNPKAFLTGDPGMRNVEAEAFATRCKLLYASSLMRQIFEFDEWWCSIHFSLGVYCGWGGRGSLNTPDFAPDELARKVVDDTLSKLIPLVRPIKTSGDLLRFLEKTDSTTPPLLQVGDYYRAAQIAFLARKVGAARSATKNILLGFSLHIRDSIDKSRFTPETYIDQILDDADAAFAGDAASAAR